MDSQTAELAGLISAAESVLILTGAGISTASGIPDFRGPDGVWTTQTPVPFDEFLRSEDRRRDYWTQKAKATEAFQNAKPNVVHLACVSLELAGKLELIVTQNVDGLHLDAGTTPGNLVEIHGTGREAGCLTCGERTPVQPHVDRFLSTNEPPRCHCCGFLKPATISFGQALDAVALDRASLGADRCDLVIALGSTLGVYPAAEIPLGPSQRGVPYAIVNMGRTDHDSWNHVTLRIEGDVSEVFPAAVSAAIGP
ncbi:MAG: Sir2 family NAD-dependent protein deacetylase [Actinomycetota bacterium]|nr:Sir2 family NAD-dependent protein deacetylase [Actinomycetota bacterium]